MKTLAAIIGDIILIVAALVGLELLFAWPTELLVNYVFAPGVLVTLFGGPLTIWKAWALNAVASILFKSTSSSSSKD
jgi:arginine exporter protein ArgO